ncbi:MAG: hypothetical protein QOE97_722 [Pseudonocardiales bacterium]|jgi:predicted nucleotidyltransferase|nr:hypothetical protein [Pseudonocardiales bacterium]
MPTDNHAAQRDALKRAASVLKAAGVPFALAGSYALWVRGAPESEHDVDFVVAQRQTEEAANALSDAGLTVTRPPEDWLFKVDVNDVVVDVLHRQAGEPVTPEVLARADEIEVLAIRMPVLSTNDLVVTKLKVLSEHYCDFGNLLPSVRAVREQLDWGRLRDEVAGNDFACAFLYLADRLGLSDRRD